MDENQRRLVRYRYCIDKRYGNRIITDTSTYSKLCKTVEILDKIGKRDMIVIKERENELCVVVRNLSGNEAEYILCENCDNVKLDRALYRIVNRYCYYWVSKDMKNIESNFDSHSIEFGHITELAYKTLRFIRLRQLGFQPTYKGIGDNLGLICNDTLHKMLNILDEVV